jgi:ribose/xylose/arabinose/galactoside ABC-type transport system permease subunit
MESSVAAVPPVGWAKRLGRRMVQYALNYGTYLIFLALCAAVAVTTPNFLTASNLSNVLLQVADIGIVAVGVTFVIIARGIDVSVGAIVALGSAAGVAAMKSGGEPWYVGVALILLVGLIVGTINGFASSKLGMPSFLVTLATLTMARGLVLTLSEGRSYYGLPPIFQGIGLGLLGPVPIPVVIMLVTFVIGHLILSRTVFGRQVYAVGGNPEAARVSGIRVERTILLTFVLSGLFSALASIVLTSRLDAFAPSMGTGYEFSAIAAVVIGGTSLYGGQGNLVGTLVGVLLIGVINNALNLMGVSAYYQDVARGGIIFAAVLFDTLRKRYAVNV